MGYCSNSALLIRILFHVFEEILIILLLKVYFVMSNTVNIISGYVHHCSICWSKNGYWYSTNKKSEFFQYTSVDI